MGIPIVTLLLEGGRDALRIIKDRLAEGIPCVAIEGSGRAADILSYAHKVCFAKATSSIPNRLTRRIKLQSVSSAPRVSLSCIWKFHHLAKQSIRPSKTRT